MTDSSQGAGAEPRPHALGGEPGEALSLGRILRTFLPDLHGPLGLGQRKLSVLWKLGACGQAELLGHCVYACPECQHQHWVPRSCGDRHCPRCLSAKSFRWLEQQLESLLAVTYYHGVFTLPQELHALVFAHQKELYPLLFDCAAQSLLEFGRQRLGGDLGITSVLHTWGQKLDYHPHLHCIMTGGALSPSGRRWRSPKQRKFLFPVRAVAALFRGKFLAGLRHLLQRGRLPFADPLLLQASHRERWFAALYRQRWVVYTKRPFGGPEQVLRYLANYTHRVAISNRRFVAIDEAQRAVSFRYRDYRDASHQKVLTLSAQEPKRLAGAEMERRRRPAGRGRREAASLVNSSGASASISYRTSWCAFAMVAEAVACGKGRRAEWGEHFSGTIGATTTLPVRARFSLGVHAESYHAATTRRRTTPVPRWLRSLVPFVRSRCAWSHSATGRASSEEADCGIAECGPNWASSRVAGPTPWPKLDSS